VGKEAVSTEDKRMLFKLIKGLIVKDVQMREELDFHRMLFGVLIRNGALTQETYDRAKEASQEQWADIRKQADAIGNREPQSLDELLRSFEGPIQ
jgi:hypothetical protein